MSSITAKGRIIGRTAFSEHPIRVQVRDGERKGATFYLTKEEAALSTIGPYQLEEKVWLEIDGDDCRITGKVPTEDVEETPVPTP